MELLGKVEVHGKVIEKILHGGRVLGIVPFGGAEGIRTPYLRDANSRLGFPDTAFRG
jgi:hypothetical protein